MPRGKSPFSLHKRPANKKEAEKKRESKKYKAIFYVQFRDQEGNYTSAISTGETSRGAAESWAYSYMRKGNIPTHRGFTFAKFARNWWIPGKCDYLREQEADGYKKSAKYIAESRRNLEKRLLPYFGHMKLSSINVKDIIRWKNTLYSEGDPETGKPLKPATINRALATLKVMLKEAVRHNYLQVNPAKDVGILKESPKPKGTLTREEATALLDNSAIDEVWAGDEYHYTLNLVAAYTGMRLGELLGLQRKHVTNSVIEVRHSWGGTSYGLGDTKTHEHRDIPLPQSVFTHLQSFMKKSVFQEPDDLVFARHENGTPISDKRVDDMLYHALEQIKIPQAERERRNITFHSWRVFFNTAALNAGLSEKVVRSITGHKTDEMTKHYTRPNVGDLDNVTKFQEGLLHGTQ